ncbi:MAG: protein-methionine-sulfoxide reductase catalytic subunit MsrP [Pseudomonadota bacterium]|nr:protein-methionine-sulfoxide reductase catalytic subunit MsrP [Pseudomonadota bacterium]
MLIKKRDDIPPSEITEPEIWIRRRELIKAAALGAGLLASGRALPLSGAPTVRRGEKIPNVRESRYSTKEEPTDYEIITSYNNFVELGSGKRRPALRSDSLRTRPWILKVEGECEAPGEIGIEEILKVFPQEERIYRLRCVEAWAMVVPWVGFPLGDMLKRFKPTSQAKYVAFETLYDPNQMPGQISGLYDWPYREGLRMDEAMHPLTILAAGLYGEGLPGQNGAPLRLVVPWKYGYKSIKSIVRISFTKREPPTTWNRLQPEEYGFYSNVNPKVSHPRWNQRSHRMVGDGWFARRRTTEMFNGYADQVAHLYAGMDLRKFY